MDYAQDSSTFSSKYLFFLLISIKDIINKISSTSLIYFSRDTNRNQNMSVVLPVLQTISNFSSGPNNYIEVLMDADLLNSIWWYMTPDTHQSLRRNAILTISNLAAGNEGIVRKVVYNENIMQTVINHVTVPGHLYSAEECKWIPSSKSTVPDTKDEWRIVKEALWVLSNITTLANDDSIW